MPFQLKNTCYLLLTSLLHYKECKVFKDTIILVLVDWNKCRFSNRISPHSKMITFVMMQFQCHNHIVQAITIAKLTKHQCKMLVPAREWLNISISIVFINQVTKLILINKFNQLDEDIFIFVHVLFLKKTVKDYISIISKIYS